MVLLLKIGNFVDIFSHSERSTTTANWSIERA